MAYEARENRNPNNCAACDHRKPEVRKAGWCAMFLYSPVTVCLQHTARYARLKGCRRVLSDGKPCGLNAPCPDCGPSLIG